MSIVPILDFESFLKGDTIARLATASRLLQILSEVGFVMLKGYQSVIPEVQVEEAFKQTRAFFDLPLETKDSLAWISPESNRGYVAQGRERVTQSFSTEDIVKLRAAAPDHKETMEIGKDFDTVCSNRWPGSLPEFKPFMNTFFVSCHELHLELLRALALALDLGEHFFDSQVNEMAHNLRLLNYPSVNKRKIENGGNRAGAHSDYGSVTLLFQDNLGGLEVQDSTGDFVPVKPVPQTIVVNIGDLLQRYSNDTLKSTIHRVVLPSVTAGTLAPPMTPKRNSIAFFSNFNLHQIISTLPGLGPPKYEPIESETYLISRLAMTYT